MNLEQQQAVLLDDKSTVRGSYQDHSIDIAKCQQHRHTSILGKPISGSRLCQCCGLKFQKEQLDPMFVPEDIYYLGSGFVLYFGFIKVCVIISFLTTVVFSLVTIYFNYTTRDCQSAQAKVVRCANSEYLKMSVANKLSQEGLLKGQAYLADATIILLFIAFQVARKKLRNIDVQANAELDPSDYAIMLRLPHNNYSSSDIIDCIDQWWELQKYGYASKNAQHPLECIGEKFFIEKVVISYQISAFRQLQKQQNSLNKEIKEAKKKDKSAEKKRVKEINEIMKQKGFMKNSKCVVVFRYPEQKKYILEKHQFTLGKFLFPFCFNLLKFENHRIKILKAALPTQICWQNHQIKHRKKFFSRFFVKLFCLLLILAAEAGIYGLLRFYFDSQITVDPSFSRYISPTISIAINIINFVLYKLLTWISKYEYRPTTLQEKVSITVKITICIFLNSGIMLMAAYFFLNISSIWITNGFIDTMTYSFLLSIIIPNVLRYANLDYITLLYKRIKIRCFHKKLNLTQEEANKCFQRPEIEIYQKYAWMINMVWWGSIFSPLIPIAYPCVFVSLFVHYWNQKFQYIACIKEPKAFGSYLNLEMLSILETTPLFLACGNLGLNIILLKIKHLPLQFQVLFVDLIAVGISSLFLVMPSQHLNRFISWMCCIELEVKSLNTQYSEQASKFITTYQLQNPVYKQEAIAKMTKKMIKLNSSKVIHPIKQFATSKKSYEQPEDSYDAPYTPRIEMKTQPSKVYIPPLPITPTSKKLPVETQMVNFTDVVAAEHREQVVAKVKDNIQKMNNKP